MTVKLGRSSYCKSITGAKKFWLGDQLSNSEHYHNPQAHMYICTLSSSFHLWLEKSDQAHN